MKRLIVLLATASVLGCSQGTTGSSATLVGAHDLVQVGELLFTTSTDRDELRVLNLAPPSTVIGSRDWVRAPNPLEALSIPVLARPSSLSRDSHFTDFTDVAGVSIPLGTEKGGPWVYASRAGGSQISVVGAGPAALVEVIRLPASAAVTATAGLSLAATSRLYFATFDGEAATLQSLDLPTTVAGLRPASAALADQTQRIDEVYKTLKVFRPMVGEVIVDLLMVPGIVGRGICEDPAQSCVVYATRSMQGRAGRVLLFDPVSLAQKELHFPGPVRTLAIHAGTLAMGGTRYVPPGLRVFGILDEERCGGPECGGVIAVDSMTGEIALDSSNLPMLPISTGASLATGLSIAARGQLPLPAAGVTEPGTTPPLPTIIELTAAGAITTSNGTVIFFDAYGLIPFDLNTVPTFASPINVGMYRPDGVLHAAGDDDGGIPDFVAGPVFDAGTPGITFANGAWHSEVIHIVVNGLIPGAADLPIADGGSAELDVPASVIDRVQTGDTLVFGTAALADGGTVPAECGRSTVTAVTATSVKAPALAGKCDLYPRSRFAIRAGLEGNRYVISGTLTGYLGRAGPNQTFSYKGGYYQRTPSFDPSAPTFTVLLGPEEPRLSEDWRWSIDVQPADVPFALRIDSSSVGCSSNVASSVVWDTERQSVFSVFPSANGIIEVITLTAHNGVLVSGEAICWR